jgi:hypothetical protein
MLNEAEVIDKFSRIIPQLPPEAFDDRSPPDPSLLLASDGPFEVFYAPLDYVNATAKIAIVGLTPGKHTMYRSLAVAKSAIERRLSWEETQRQAKLKATFSNARKSLTECWTTSVCANGSAG